MTILDEHGQPNFLFNRKLRHDRGVDEMLGLARGLIADGVVSDEEASALRAWALRNEDLCASFPGRDLLERLVAIFDDGRVAAEERLELHAFLQELAGDTRMADSPKVGGSTVLPLTDPPPAISHEGSRFVVTGKFLCGCRAFVTSRLESRGAIVQKAITQETDYLLLGSMASRDWMHSSFGRKIEKAVEYRDKGIPIAIVAEDHWASQLRGAI